MNDFGRTLLKKYGWTEGKGLGKDESGMVEALKPKLKRDTAGISYNAANDLTNNWWESVFNSAANNIAIESDTSSITIRAINKDGVNINRNMLNSRTAEGKLASKYGNFLKTSTLLNDGTVVSEKSFEKSKAEESKEDTLCLKLSDEELFKTCGGRTAHKGARHGLALNGKLARIAQQEKELSNAERLLDIESYVEKNSAIRTEVAGNKKSKQHSVRDRKHKRGLPKVDDNENNISLVQSVTLTDTEELSLFKKLKRRLCEVDQLGSLKHNKDDDDTLNTSAESVLDLSSRMNNICIKENKSPSKRKRRRDAKDEDINIINNNTQSAWASLAIEQIPLPKETNQFLIGKSKVKAEKIVDEKNKVFNGKHVNTNNPQAGSSSSSDVTTKKVKSRRRKHTHTHGKDNTSNAHKLKTESTVSPLAQDSCARRDVLKHLKRSRSDEDKTSDLSQKLSQKSCDSRVTEKATANVKKRKIKCLSSKPNSSVIVVQPFVPRFPYSEVMPSDNHSKKELGKRNRRRCKRLRKRFNQKQMKQQKKVELLIQDFMAVSLKVQSKEDDIIQII